MQQVNPVYVEALRNVVKEAPFPRRMAMALDRIDIDRAVVTLDLAACHLQPFGIVHGGVVATVIDTATFGAAFLRLPEDAGLVNVDLKLNYLKPVVQGRLTASGDGLRAGKAICCAEAKVYDADQALIAHGTSTLMVLPGKGLHVGVPKFVGA